MRIIPKKTKVTMEFFKGVELLDVAVGMVGALIAVSLLVSNVPFNLQLIFVVLIVFVGLLLPLDNEKAYMTLFYTVRYFARVRRFRQPEAEQATPDTSRQIKLDDTRNNFGPEVDITAGIVEDLDELKWNKAKGKKPKAKKEKKTKPPSEETAESETKKKPASKKVYVPHTVTDITPFTGIDDCFIEYGGEYSAIVIEIPSIEFRFLTLGRQNSVIDRGLGSVLRSVTGAETAAIVKIDRPIVYDSFIKAEERKLEEIKEAFVNELLDKDELKSRAGIIYDRIDEVKRLNQKDKVYRPFHYLVLFEKDKNILRVQAQNAVSTLVTNDLYCHILEEKELAVFLKYNYDNKFDEREVYSLEPDRYMDWILPKEISFDTRIVRYDGLVTHNLRITEFPTMVSNAWGHELFNTPDTRVVLKMKPVDRFKSVRRIDRAIDELRGQMDSTGKTSKLLELDQHLDTLSELLVMLQGDNEILFDVNIYITIYDHKRTEQENSLQAKYGKAKISTADSIKKQIKRRLSEQGFRSTDMMMQQFEAYASGCLSGYDAMITKSRGIHSGSVAAAFPFVYSSICDKDGFQVGVSGDTPVFVNFFQRDRERVNSNMVVIGKSGSGKSYATKTLLANLAAEDSKVFILDPENEYPVLAENLHGKVIDVGSATQGRLNPFHIITGISDDEESDTQGKDGEVVESANTAFNVHMQFLEEFFRQILPGMDADALEYLNNLILRMYESKGIDSKCDLSKLTASDFPIFDDLYDKILSDFQASHGTYSKSNLRVLLNYISKFSTGGRNSALWNGEATLDTKENFIVFNFQSLLANKNNTIANAQMLLILKWLDNEIIKNRDYNLKYGANRRIIVVIDEAHVFIDEKYPVALDFMYQLAKRIRKYNGMQIIITQNIKDFVGTEEIAKKSTAIINACQYSFIFPLAPNDMHDLCKLYEKAGAINESEQDEIINNGRGRAFVVTSPQSRTCIDIVATNEVREMFTM